jgi:Ras-related protein Rab-5C
MHAPSPRVVVIGSTFAGKTALIKRIMELRFDDRTETTTGTAFFLYKSDHPKHPEIQIWDTAGMERYRSVNSLYYREAVAAILVFDLTRLGSFQELESWRDEFLTNAPPNPTIIVCANKCDLMDEIEVEPDEIQQFCNTYDLPLFQTSAFTGEGINPAIRELLDRIPLIEAPESTILTPALSEEKKCKC